jgi:flagellar motor switch protein FliM
MATLDTTDASIENPLPVTPDAPISPFRFSSASSLSSSRQDVLNNWHRQFLRGAAGRLTDLLRLVVEVELEGIEVQSYGQMVADRGEESQGLIFRLQPQPGLWLLDVPMPLALQLVDRMMGGSGAIAEKTRDLTPVEETIFEQFAEALLTDYAGNWRPHTELQPEIVRPVRSIKGARSLGHQDEDLLLRVGFRVGLKESKSVISMLIPIASIEELLLRLGAAEDGATAEKTPVIRKDTTSTMGAIPMQVSIRWQGFQISLREVEALAPGDVLVLDNKRCETAAVWLGDRPKFSGRLVRETQKTILTITETLD